MKKSFGEPLGFAVSLLILPWAFWFCREVRSGYNMFYIIVRGQEARLRLRLEQLSRFFLALQTSHVHP